MSKRLTYRKSSNEVTYRVPTCKAALHELWQEAAKRLGLRNPPPSMP